LSVKGNGAAFPLVAAAGPAAAAPVADLDGRPATEKQPIIVIDNYDSFTYNLCQVICRSMFPVVGGLFPSEIWCGLYVICACGILATGDEWRLPLPAGCGHTGGVGSYFARTIVPVCGYTSGCSCSKHFWTFVWTSSLIELCSVWLLQDELLCPGGIVSFMCCSRC
jgi:hypothetical protein